MTESEARTKPISEVWEHFKSADENYPRTKHIRDRLRAVLLERCKNIADACGLKTTIHIIGISVYTDRQDVYDPKYSRIDKAETALDISAAYAFWAWELKQRQDESNG